MFLIPRQLKKKIIVNKLLRKKITHEMFMITKSSQRLYTVKPDGHFKKVG